MAVQRVNDFRNIQIGSVTTQGNVKFIYGASENFIVFLSDTYDLKCLSERNDNVYKNAGLKAKEISAKAFKKLDKVKIHDVNDHIASCLVDALSQDPEKKIDLDKIFKPASNFIKKQKKTKKVIGRGPNPQHIVYINSGNNVGWETREIPEHSKVNLAKLDRQKQMSQSMIPSFLRGSVVSLIGNAATAVIRSNAGEDLNDIINKSEEHLESRIKEFNFILYFFASLFITAIVFGVIYISNIETDIYSKGILGGSVGALISALQRTSQNKLSIYESRVMIVIQALSRGLLGLISGALLVAASQADIALGFISESPDAILIFGIAVGFAERWMPDFLKSLTQKSLDNNA